MFDIDESGAPGYNWTNKVKGYDINDPVEGGVSGASNVPLIQLALRTKNLLSRLLPIEGVFVGYNMGTPLQSLFVILNNLINTKADLTTANLNSGHVANWQAKLGINNLVVRSGVASFTGINNGSSNDYTIVLASALPNYDPSTHRFLLTVEKATATGITAIHGYAYIKTLPASGTLTNFVASFFNIGGNTSTSDSLKFHWAIIKQL